MKQPLTLRSPTLAKIAAVAAAGLLTACATPPAPTMGSAPDAKPPKLVTTDKKDPATGRVLLDWDRPGAFGVVVGDLKAVGDGACMAARIDLEALGYHAQAADVTGVPMPGGGFFCYPRANGEKADAVAPRLVLSKGSDSSGRTWLAWDRPGAFGKVPTTLQSMGDMACISASIELEAIAYHPKAMGVDGSLLPGGGFFCFRKKQGNEPAELAPRLVRLDGVPGWDRPVAFGAVPAMLKARGDAVCGTNSGLEAIGHHPSALNEKGQPIVGGGFLCAPKAGAVRRG